MIDKTDVFLRFFENVYRWSGSEIVTSSQSQLTSGYYRVCSNQNESIVNSLDFVIFSILLCS